MKFLITLALFNLFFLTHTTSRSVDLIPNDIYFNVYRNDSPIGFHKIKFSKDQSFINALIEIKFEVKFLGFVVYDYFHKNNETWINNSLVELNTSTDKNGDLLNCNLKKSADGFIIEGTNGNESTSTSPLPTSYWNKILVEKGDRKILNTQDCSYIDFKINLLGEEKIYENSLITDHYKLLGKEITGELVDIDIWYDKSNQWVKMIFVKDGSTIEYKLDKYDSE